jgi:hypothetical protein
LTDTDALNDLANANSVWQQAWVQFSLNGGSVGHLNSSQYLDTLSNPARENLKQTIPGNQGYFKVFYVRSCPDQSSWFGETTVYGTVICVHGITQTLNTGTTVASRLNTTLAHELGHAQGYCPGPDTVPALDDAGDGNPHSVNLLGVYLAGALQADITIAQVNALCATSSQ